VRVGFVCARGGPRCRVVLFKFEVCVGWFRSSFEVLVGLVSSLGCVGSVPGLRCI